MRTSTHRIFLDGKEIDRSTLEIENVDTRDYPDFCDAMFSSACFADGKQLTDEQLDLLTSQEGCLLNEMAHEHYVGRDFCTD